jgi:hypothetical protein
MPLSPLACQLPNLDFGDFVGFAAKRRRAIKAPKRAAETFLPRFEIAAALQRMQHRVEGAGTESVAVNHPLAVKLFFRRVMQDVQANKTSRVPDASFLPLSPQACTNP